MYVYHIVSGLIICFSVCIYFIIKQKKLIKSYLTLEKDLLLSDNEIQNILLLGLYQRFQEKDKDNSLELKNFVAKILKSYYGGSVYITDKLEDYGIDIQHYRPNEGLCIGKVILDNINNLTSIYPIAIIHSQMIKQNSKNGFVITTSSFSEEAIEYSQDLNIELIDGKKIVEYWVKGFKENKKISKILINQSDISSSV